MNTLSRRLFGGLAIAALVGLSAPAFAQDGKPHLILTLESGTVDIELLPELAPKHVERIIALTERGSYDEVVFHRVIEGFMAQTGDVEFGKENTPNFDLGRAGMGGSELPDVEAEFSSESFQRGIVGGARSQNPNSFNSQFFITYGDASFLDGQYTVFGKVASGMEAVDALEKGPQSANGAVENPDKIIKATIEYK
jgi:cyclophilin family peptidyl-prolyl cis-trans isomerase